MIILIEGMDNTGKTTLGNELSKRLGYPYFHNERCKDPVEVYDKVSKHFNPTAPIVIQDRITPFSEAVYGPVIRGSSDYHGEHLQTLYTLSRIGLAVVYCKPPQEKVLEFGERDQMEGVVDNSTKLMKAYEVFLGQLRVAIGEGNILTYDYTQDPLTKVETFCQSRINRYLEIKRRINRAEYAQHEIINHIAGNTHE